ncbi:hypothetical protein VTL71DRAFT_620 [Oculimacula yallundae]|uniref:Uncharacterized protein n=1 Tax=Oculimacula yallundae TaxID=86028 RepID=A0ABR4D1I1_9HELO
MCAQVPRVIKMEGHRGTDPLSCRFVLYYLLPFPYHSIPSILILVSTSIIYHLNLPLSCGLCIAYPHAHTAQLLSSSSLSADKHKNCQLVSQSLPTEEYILFVTV